MKAYFFLLVFLLMSSAHAQFYIPDTPFGPAHPSNPSENYKDCMENVLQSYKSFLKGRQMTLKLIKDSGNILSPGESRRYKETEIFLSEGAREKARIFYAESSYNGTLFGHSILVGSETCEVYGIRSVLR